MFSFTSLTLYLTNSALGVTLGTICYWINVFIVHIWERSFCICPLSLWMYLLWMIPFCSIHLVTYCMVSYFLRAEYNSFFIHSSVFGTWIFANLGHCEYHCYEHRVQIPLEIVILGSWDITLKKRNFWVIWKLKSCILKK